MKQPVNADGFGKLGGLGEDVGPVFNSDEVVVNAGASVQSVAEIFLEGSSVLDCIDDVLACEVSEEVAGIGLDLDAAGVASFDLGKVVVSGESEDKTSDELGHSEHV